MIQPITSFVTLSYRATIPVRGLLLTENQFLKVHIFDTEYFISVLPGFHQSSLQEINLKLKTFFSQYSLNFTNIDFSKKFFNLTTLQNSFLESINEASLFNIETILLDIIRKKHPELFTHTSIAQNFLYNEKDAIDFYLDADCIKIKINPLSVKKTIQVINELYKLNSEMIYRLDGNKKFELSDLIDFEKSLKEHLHPTAFKNIDYIEEPFKNFNDSFLFKKRSELTLAIDESFVFFMKTPNLSQPVVIKPSLIGVSPIVSWLKSHAETRAIISSSFEHPSMMTSLHFLARYRPNEFHGLESYLG